MKINLPNIDVNKMLGEDVIGMAKYRSLEKAEKRRYEQDVLQTLKNIESNTVGLNEIIPLLSNNLEKQEDILEFLKESLSIGASKTKEEAESKWRKLMNKATKLTKDVETVQKLHGFANTVLQMYNNSNI